jgi:hypothetical protein
MPDGSTRCREMAATNAEAGANCTCEPDFFLAVRHGTKKDRISLGKDRAFAEQVRKKYRRPTDAARFLAQRDGTLAPVPIDDPDRLAKRRLEEEVKYLRRREGEFDKALTNREAIFQRIVESAQIEVPKLHLKIPPPRGKKLPVRSAVLPIFDIQYGQLVQAQDTPLGLGTYSTSIFQERLARWYEAVTESLLDYSTSHAISELVIALGGDLVEGADIFAGQAWQLEVDPAKQTVELSVYLAETLGNLIAFCKTEIGVKKVMVACVPGNHGKVGGKKAGAIPATMSWDWLCAEFLKLRLSGHPIDVFAIESGGALLFKSMSHLFLLIHGQEVRGWGGIPFYGFTRFDGRAIRMTGEIFDYCLSGHIHQPAVIPNGSGGEYIISGDWVGANNLSGQIVAASRPQQRLIFVSEKWGLSENVPIYFAEAARPKPHIYSTAAA